MAATYRYCTHLPNDKALLGLRCRFSIKLYSSSRNLRWSLFLDQFELPQPLRKCAQLTTISFSAQLAVSPILGFYFEELSLLALPLSIIASPVLPLVMLIGIIGLIAPVGQITNNLLTSLFVSLYRITPQQIQVCIELPEVIGLYLTLALLVYIAHKSLHKRREKEY